MDNVIFVLFSEEGSTHFDLIALLEQSLLFPLVPDWNGSGAVFQNCSAGTRKTRLPVGRQVSDESNDFLAVHGTK
ncbi:MAG: hypothetical protein IJR49_04585 [Treponema sp.]|nr:hypothetical protein [Treponema sp.]